jgi:hypothetical protein
MYLTAPDKVQTHSAAEYWKHEPSSAQQSSDQGKTALTLGGVTFRISFAPRVCDSVKRRVVYRGGEDR